jgi:di/tricarboxylate transporter
MSAAAWITLILLLVMLVTFIGGWLAPEVVALGGVGVFLACGVLTPEQALAGFASPALISLLGLFVLSDALFHTGALDRLRELLSSDRIRSPRRMAAFLALAVGAVSSVVPNTPLVASLLRVLESWCHRRGIRPSRVLMPLSFASILGGTLTLIGTSTSLLASDVSARLGIGPLGLFSLTAVGVPVWLIGSAYLVLAADRLPDRGEDPRAVLRRMSLEGYLTEVRIPAGSRLVGQTLHASRLQRRFDVDVLALRRAGEVLGGPLSDVRLRIGDRLMLRCSRQDLLRLQQDHTVQIEDGLEEGRDGALAGLRLTTEVLIPARSVLVGTSMREIRFRQRFNATVLAVKRAGQVLSERMGRIVLRAGDLLLLQAPMDAVRGLQAGGEVLVLDDLEPDLPTTPRRWLALAVFVAVLLLAGSGAVPLVAAVLLGVTAVVLGGCVDASRLQRAVRWDLYMLLAGLLALSAAVEATGLAAMAVAALQRALADWPPYPALVVLYAATMLITEVLSNAATVVLLLPVAVQLAAALGQPSMAFVLTVVFASSQSFLSPIGYQTNLMVRTPGSYTFLDYLRFGLPLSLLLAALTPALILLAVSRGWA